MDDLGKIKKPLLQLEHFIWGLVAVWTIVVATSLVYHMVQTKQESLEEAQIQARAAYEKDIIYRRWNAVHGGVYVLVTKETQPNPHLSDIPERDITTPSGKTLTLMNPAYMTRQAHELEKQKLGVRGHITSLNPIRPDNAPDSWETEALRAFERGEAEISSVEDIEGKKYMRLMRPLITEKGCLKCHAKQGYHEGDIRGGISVSIPMEPFWAMGRKHIITFALVYGLLWMVGLSGLALGTQRLKRTDRERRQAEEALQKAHDELERKVEERTADLSKANIFLEGEISERKRAEEQSKELQEYLQLQINRMPIGLIVWDPEFRVQSWNPATEKIFGFTVEEMMGKHPYGLIVPKEVQSHVDSIWQRLLEGDSTAHSVNDNMTKDGRTITCEWSNTPIKEADGTVLRVLSMVQDISERKRTEQEMRTLEEQLRQSQKMEAIGQLAGGIAHDFNNLLTIMKGHSQLALMELKEGDPFRESFEEIEKATTRSANLVRQILAFSRRQVMQMIVLDLNNLLKNLEKMLRRIIGEDIELLTVLADDLGRVKTDPGQIEQVVFNLAVNARDAMPSGGKLTIETANVELDEAYARNHFAVKPGRYVMIAVSDTGVGMTPEIRERVFEPFFTTKEKGKGTGLGLATVYGIVKQSGGNIWIYSEPGQGTTLKIYLPRVEELLTEEKEKEESGLFRGVGVILVVEDEEEVRKMVVKMLKKQGYSVLEADDEEEALLLCQQHKDTIHLMVTDVVMPRISGPELAKRLVVFHPEMKVLYMSGYADNAIVHHGVLKEGVNFIQKPFTIDGLTKKVREVLEKDPKPAI